jgi:heme A synthase
LVRSPTAPSPFAFDLGRGLHLIQSFLLLVTFFWALAERKRYRRADKFSDLAVKFTAETLDQLYTDVLKDLEKAASIDSRAGRSQRRLPTIKAKAIANFSTRLFHARTIILHRIGCFRGIDQGAIESLFEQMEDDFTLAIANLPTFDDHPEFATAEIARAP